MGSAQPTRATANCRPRGDTQARTRALVLADYDSDHVRWEPDANWPIRNGIPLLKPYRWILEGTFRLHDHLKKLSMP